MMFGTLPRCPAFREVSVSELTLPRLDAGEIHLCAVGLASNRARIETMDGLLGPAERERAARYRFTHHRRRYVVRWGAVRSVLAQHLRCRPAAVRFVRGPAGKPAVMDHPGLHFNLSHSGDLALIAVGRDARSASTSSRSDLSRTLTPLPGVSSHGVKWMPT